MSSISITGGSPVSEPVILTLGASAEAVPFLSLLMDEGLSVICMDRNPTLPEEFTARHKGQLKCLARDFGDIGQAERTVVEEGITHTLALPVGRSLTAMGRINDRFGFAGPSFAAIDIMTDKLSFHNFQLANGLNDAGHIVIESGTREETVSRVEEIEAALDYPFIAKPVWGSGSQGVRVIKNRNDLLAYELPERFAGCRLLLEKMIGGIEFSTNVFVDESSRCHMMGLFRKEITAAPYRQESCYYSDEFSKQSAIVINYMNRICTLLKLSNCFINADVIIDGNNRPYIVDISPRLGGNNLLRLLRFNGNNPLKIFNQAVIRGSKDVAVNTSQKTAVLRFFNFIRSFCYHQHTDDYSAELTGSSSAAKGKIPGSLYNERERQCIVEIVNRLEPGKMYGPMFSGADTARGHIFVCHESIRTADELTVRYLNWLIDSSSAVVAC